MKVTCKKLSYDRVLSLPPAPHRSPVRPPLPLRAVMCLLGRRDLKETHFHCEQIGMEQLKKGEPALYLMNHSSFIDLKIAQTVLFPRPFSIVTTADGFVGKAGLMRWLGCIPTQKFISDPVLVRDMLCALRKKKQSVLMYPEASYSFDGTATPLPESLGKCLKLLKVPVVIIRTEGAFSRDPLYNMLQNRQVPVSATMKYLFSPEEIQALSVEELNEGLKREFTFDGFRWQQENHIRIAEPFRADGLDRVLYKCPACRAEGRMKGQGTRLSCGGCGKAWQLNEYGVLEAEEGEAFFTHVPDWYAWQRTEVRRELMDGRYLLDTPVIIRMLVDRKAVYEVGEGRLIHDETGFTLTGCEGRLSYQQSPLYSYSLYADYYWYELGDVIAIGTPKAIYYCFPQSGWTGVAKARLAAEELYKLKKAVRRV